MNKGKELVPPSCTLILFTLSHIFLVYLYDTILVFVFLYLSTVDIRKSVKAFLQSCKGRQHRLAGVVSLCVVYIHHLLFWGGEFFDRGVGRAGAGCTGALGHIQSPRGGRCLVFVCGPAEVGWLLR